MGINVLLKPYESYTSRYKYYIEILDGRWSWVSVVLIWDSLSFLNFIKIKFLFYMLYFVINLDKNVMFLKYYIVKKINLQWKTLNTKLKKLKYLK